MQSGPAPSRDWSMHLGFVWLGLAMFGAVSLLAMLTREGDIGLVGGLLLAASALGVAALAYWGLRWRGLAIGLAGGYALMTLVSGGACTGWRTDELGYGMIAGAALYVLALGLFAVIALGVEVYRAVKGK